MNKKEFEAIAAVKRRKINFSEENVKPYILPSPLLRENDSRITSVAEFEDSGRKRLLGLFEKNMYGRIMPPPDRLSFKVVSEDANALNGIAVRKEIEIFCRMSNGCSKTFTMLLYLPKMNYPVPCFLGLNFYSNAGCTSEKSVALTSNPQYHRKPGIWIPEPATATTRGKQAACWDFENIVRKGFASATIYYFDLFPDGPEWFGDSIYRLFKLPSNWNSPERDFGAIGAWAWGLMRGVDCLASLAEIDSGKIIVHGHSRLGKTALLAGAYDSRISMVIANCSGCCGAALTRRNFGENLEWILHYQPHWFVPKLNDFIDKESELPFDQHSLISLIAPRPVYISSATEDPNADPRGEFLATFAAGEVYHLYGDSGLSNDVMPPPDTPVGSFRVKYHIRTGPHGLTHWNWIQYLDFAENYFSSLRSQ